MKKPVVLKPKMENIPQFLKDLPNWVVWRRMKRDQKWTKPPYDPKNGNPAKANDPETWADFETAWGAYTEGSYDGIGFQLSEDLGLIGFDFDHVVQDGKIVDPDVSGFIQLLDSYAETSPSGDGLRVFAFGELPEGRRKAGPYEMYADGRYLTITGHHLEGSPREIRERPEQIRDVHRAVFQEPDAADHPAECGADRSPAAPPDHSDDVSSILDKAFSSKNGDQIRMLYNGDWEGAGCPSQSEADMKLCRHLAFWFRKDPALMDQVFRESGLYRPKWDVKRGKETYGAMTISKAIDSTGETYSGGKSGKTADDAVHGDNGKPDAPEEESEEEKDRKRKAKAKKVLDELNAKHAVVMVGGKCCILNEVINPDTKRPDINFSSVQDFMNKYANKSIFNPSTKKEIKVGRYWFNHKARRQYEGIVFHPGGKSTDYFNLWRGFAVEPKPGEWNKLYEHIFENIAQGNKEWFQWLMSWMARLVQDPGGEPPGSAVVLPGKKGTGKGTFARNFGSLFGTHFFHITNQKHLTGRFNSHLKDVILAFVDEGFWAPDKSSEGAFKAIITEPEIVIEPKGKDAFSVRNFVNVIVASNERFVVPAGLGERRFFVLEMGDAHQQDTEYFKAINKQMKSGGREAMLYDLLQYDYTKVDLRNPPKTPALLAQIENGMNIFEQWWYEALIFGDNDGRGEWQDRVPCKTIQNLYLDYADKKTSRGYRLSEFQIGRRLKELCPEIKREKATRIVAGERPGEYSFPSLEKCRKDFEDKLRMTLCWEKLI